VGIEEQAVNVPAAAKQIANPVQTRIDGPLQINHLNT
jgi:hypothetical protein